jgi:hypothetical protein
MCGMISQRSSRASDLVFQPAQVVAAAAFQRVVATYDVNVIVASIGSQLVVTG